MKLKPNVRQVCGPRASIHIRMFVCVCVCERQAVTFHSIGPFKCVLLISLRIDTFHIIYLLAMNKRLFFFIIMSQSPFNKQSISVTLYLSLCISIDTMWLIVVIASICSDRFVFYFVFHSFFQTKCTGNYRFQSTLTFIFVSCYF